MAIQGRIWNASLHSGSHFPVPRLPPSSGCNRPKRRALMLRPSTQVFYFGSSLQRRAQKSIFDCTKVYVSSSAAMLPAGMTGLALSSGYSVVGGREPIRQKYRHLGSGPVGKVAWCSNGCRLTEATEPGSATHLGTSIPSGVTPTCTGIYVD